MDIQNNFKLKGIVNVKLIRNGKVIMDETYYNTITYSGLAEVTNLLGNVSSPSAFTYLALGTGTANESASDTALGAEITDSGLERVAATVTRTTTSQTNDTLQLTKTFTATGTKSVSECGVFNAASSGTMLGRKKFTNTANLEATDQLTVTYKIQVS